MAKKTKELPLAKTPLQRGVRTTYQALVAWLPVVIGVLTIPEVKSFVEGNSVSTVGIVSVIAGVIAYLQNKR